MVHSTGPHTRLAEWPEWFAVRDTSPDEGFVALQARTGRGDHDLLRDTTLFTQYAVSPDGRQFLVTPELQSAESAPGERAGVILKRRASAVRFTLMLRDSPATRVGGEPQRAEERLQDRPGADGPAPSSAKYGR
jgi:hypothetical protein